MTLSEWFNLLLLLGLIYKVGIIISDLQACQNLKYLAIVRKGPVSSQLNLLPCQSFGIVAGEVGAILLYQVFAILPAMIKQT